MRLTLFLLLLLPAATFAADPVKIAQPKPTKSDEAVSKTWSPKAAADYLDGVGVNWTQKQKCVTCHTNMPYLMARPMMKGDDAGWKEVRKFVEDDVQKWLDGGKPRGDAYVVATAAALAYSDARTTGKLHPMTKAALDRMWTIQLKSGEWSWLKCDWPPQEHDDYYGAALAAVAVAFAPEKYAEGESAKAGVAKLQAYLKKTPAPDLHHKATLLWAASKMDGFLTEQEKKDIVKEIKEKQRKDGGWCLPAFGKYKRRDTDKTPNDPNAESDGYGTGYAVFVLRQAGVTREDEVIKKGVEWLKTNQRESGRWYTRSLNNDKAHYISNAGSAFAVLALEACGELEKPMGR
jgi:squalene-hopene/tetraprenyl-beta-curcumene cyclase